MTIEHPAWWDPHSDQPFKLSRQQKPRITSANLIELLRTGPQCHRSNTRYCVVLRHPETLLETTGHRGVRRLGYLA